MVMKLNRFFTTRGQSNLALGEKPNSKIVTCSNSVNNCLCAEGEKKYDAKLNPPTESE
jgi:hypothetical protein